MKQSFGFLVFILTVTMSVFSQNSSVDSLQQVLKNTRNDIDRTELFNAIAVEYGANNPKLMQHYAEKALQLSKKINHRLAEGSAYQNMGNANVVLGNYVLALQSFSNAQSVFEAEMEKKAGAEKEENRNALARAYGSIGIVFSEQSNYSKALQYHLKALKIYEQTKNSEKLTRVYNNLGIVYKSLGEDFKALTYFIKCFKIQEKILDPAIGITTTNIGNIYLKQRDYTRAFENYSKAKLFFGKYPDQRGLGELYNNLGLFYKKTGNKGKALQNYALALEAFNSIEDKFGVSDTYFHIGEINLEQQNYKEALLNTSKSLQLSKELEVTEQIQDAEKRLSEIYEKLGDSQQALTHYKLYSIAKDSVSNHENIRNSVRAEMNFEFEKKETLQKEEQEKREIIYQEQAKRHQLQIWYTVLLVLSLCGIGFLIYSRIQLKKNLTLQKDLAEYEQKALHLQMNPHFVFNCLGSISSFIVQNGTDSAIKYLSKFSKLMRLTLEYSKETLIPIDKEIESLQNYLELEQLRFNQKFSFSIVKGNDIEDDMALPPLLLQPFVENAIIHGLIPKKEAGTISIDFSLNHENLICSITDNGIGFNKSKELKENLVSVHKSMALDITKKRLEMMQAYTSKKAKVEIEELNDNGSISGTKVVLKLPIQYIK
ncbi:tetratricopeptide repeat protein [Flavobacterium sp. SM15]|uniref:tetratricopeptide repeat-containing sensor histidine kinase n=1 Tax=Flavobacterium sp. SM15 TaxID=2908005 RepID=UPI001ED9E367|nr:tetratricopeptide repeat protein [Flavobacterium sp. SM15]MCG2611313.1 tetratricopeptide repeat protein [Flavobacterium sp. SM15]